MQIQPTTDTALIRSVVTDKAVWPHVSDDGADLETYQPPIDGVLWLGVFDGECLGAYMVHQHNAITWEIHTCLLPQAWGEKARQAGRLVLDWIFANTACQKLITQVPQTNPLALRYAKRCGLVVEGNNRQSFLKNGQAIDQIQLGITKKEHVCQ